MLEVGRKMEPSIETSFYPDDIYSIKEKMRNMKKTMTLDLDCSMPKRQKFSLLSSPDLHMLKLASPELENLIIQQQNGNVTTTPTPTQFIFPKNVTEEQEMYARGFVDALAELQGSYPNPESGQGDVPTTAASTNSYTTTMLSAIAHNSSLTIIPPYPTSSTATTTCTTSASSSAYNFSHSSILNIKEEPQTVPSVCATPPLSPIDMMAQERIKLERKRQRNRVAASKCRKRKLERIARLEGKVNVLKNENTDLGNVVTKLKEHICSLKQQLMEHVNSGCQILTPSQY